MHPKCACKYDKSWYIIKVKCIQSLDNRPVFVVHLQFFDQLMNRNWCQESEAKLPNDVDSWLFTLCHIVQTHRINSNNLTASSGIEVGKYMLQQRLGRSKETKYCMLFCKYMKYTNRTGFSLCWSSFLWLPSVFFHQWCFTFAERHFYDIKLLSWKTLVTQQLRFILSHEKQKPLIVSEPKQITPVNTFTNFIFRHKRVSIDTRQIDRRTCETLPATTIKSLWTLEGGIIITCWYALRN